MQKFKQRRWTDNKQIMAEIDVDQIEDLEDGEIESDHEQNNDDSTKETVTTEPKTAESGSKENVIKETKEQSKNNKVKKSPKRDDKKDKKRSKDVKKPKDHKNERSKEPSNSTEDDFASNIEKAIKKELKKKGSTSVNGSNENTDSGVEDYENKRKHKKRKKHDYPDKETSSKRKRRSVSEEDVDEDEMMCIRGASPVHRRKAHMERRSDEEYDSYHSDDSTPRDFSRNRNNDRIYRGRGGGRDLRDRYRRRFDCHRLDKHPSQDPDGICVFYMQGKCYKGDDCVYSHDARPPRKMELCKFYLMNCCAKKDKCLYLHSDFPCKYYHTGLPCTSKKVCKFAHGKPLTEQFKMILLKHIISAPKEILGDFPALSRESANLMVNNTQIRLRAKYSDNEDVEKNPQQSTDEIGFENDPKMEDLKNENQEHLNLDKNKKPKIRQSRWRDPSPVNLAAQAILSIQNLSGVLTQQQISQLIDMGISNLNQLSQLTVMQLNQLGITVNQINEIQLNTMNIQKLGLIDNSANPNPNLFVNKVKSNIDLDMRVSPILSEMANAVNKPSGTLGKDIDMRFQSTSGKNDSSNIKKQRPSVDVDQYTKDALKFSISDSKVDTDLTKGNDSNFNRDKNNTHSNKDLDVDHRVLNYVAEANMVNVGLIDNNNPLTKNDGGDTDIRVTSLPLKQQQMYMRIQQKNEERARRPTTDDEDDSLHIDEKWYSSDEDQTENAIKTSSSPIQDESEKINDAVAPQELDTNMVTKSLSEISKNDISDEVLKLLSIFKNNAPTEPASTASATIKKDLKSRDPRNLPKPAQDIKSTTSESSKKISHKPEFVSIYDCIENTENMPKKSDVDLRPTKDLDLRMTPSLMGDTDLRQTPGGTDVDFRLGLPLKLLPNYTPATEIDGSIGSHAPIPYKLYAVDIPRPDYTDIKNSTLRSQASGDPRLRKIFRLSIDEPPNEQEKPTKSLSSTRSDPRKRTLENPDKPIPQKSPLDIPTIIQTSDWYRDLKSNQKIMVNQQLADVATSIKRFQQDKTPGKKFDLSEIKANDFLCVIFSNLGIFLDENSEFYRINPQDNLGLGMTQMNFNLNPDPFTVGMVDNMGMMGMNTMNSGNMGPMGGMRMMGPMHNFDSRYPIGDPRGAPGILGMPPNMASNFDNSMGMHSFDTDNFSMDYDFNDPGNNGDDYMNDNDMNDDYYRERVGYHMGRNNERWNRGRSRGNNSGGRDRRGYTERGNWNNDRH